MDFVPEMDERRKFILSFYTQQPLSDQSYLDGAGPREYDDTDSEVGFLQRQRHSEKF